ncbi:MAG TPA: phosphatidylglycerol lysyltransferase domain-containing protein [Candidatus Saccharimonadales bacterium]|nr:phosphatidylglycerol lysyltransferase domain-containing protein [Candidatus Saccharimonadales bacterium]
MPPLFPKFANLTMDDRDAYEALVSSYPPFSDISFTTLHIWWNLDGQLNISRLDNNLVIKYSLPFDKDNSGYSLIGTHEVDSSLDVIFKFLHKYKQPKKLVHVPEFTINKIKHRDHLMISEEMDYHEYILDAKALASLEGRPHSRTRRKVRRFLREIEGSKLELRELDLELKSIRDMVYSSIQLWQKKYPIENDPENTENEALKVTLSHTSILHIRNIAVFIDDKLQGIIFYHKTVDKKHIVLNHLKVNYDLPHIFDYLTSEVAKEAIKDGVDFINMEMDLGLEGLRKHKMGLRPINFYKKYTVAVA